MDDLSKPWWTSQTIWGGAATIVAGLAGAYWAYSHGDINGALLALATAQGGLHAVVGRFQATQVIGKPATIPGQPVLGALTPAAGAATAVLLAVALTFAFAPSAHAAAAKPATNPLSAIQSQIIDAVNAIAQWTSDDIDGAISLSTAIPGIQDNVGAQCWGQFKTIGDLQKAHPLPLSAKAATDFESLRLLNAAIVQICRNSNCSQMWNDLQNQVGALSVAPLPFSMSSICAKVAPIGTDLTPTLDLKAVKVAAPAVAAKPAAEPAAK